MYDIFPHPISKRAAVCPQQAPIDFELAPSSIEHDFGAVPGAFCELQLWCTPGSVVYLSGKAFRVVGSVALEFIGMLNVR